MTAREEREGDRISTCKRVGPPTYTMTSSNQFPLPLTVYNKYLADTSSCHFYEACCNTRASGSQYSNCWLFVTVWHNGFSSLLNIRFYVTNVVKFHDGDTWKNEHVGLYVSEKYIWRKITKTRNRRRCRENCDRGVEKIILNTEETIAEAYAVAKTEEIGRVYTLVKNDAQTHTVR